MASDHDHYEAYYAQKLWALLPAVYRAEDTKSFDYGGPLHEMVDRIGLQAAILRRSLDRLWADQSIETCDDWVIPYIGDLLATNLVASLDARGQRLDVARTIYYRRRKGTVGVLEEIAGDVTGWNARVAEFFRRLARTRHGLDPAIGLPSATSDPAGARALQLAEGLVGPLTGTPLGGWADLRNVYGATKTQTAFDEFFHTADVRRGRGQVGWHNIPRLGVFLWRLKSFGVAQTTPVAVQNCPGHYMFDPTGREIPLFAATTRRFGDAWASPEEWQVPTPISAPLWQAAAGDPAARPLYAAIDPADGVTILPNSVGVFRRPGAFYELVPPAGVTIYPERGRLKTINPPANDRIYVTYHYGFASTIGAGPYDRRVLGTPPVATPAPITAVSGGGAALAAPLAALAPAGTLTIVDSLTYDQVSDVGSAASPITRVTLRAENRGRPLVRLPAGTAWTFTGSDESVLVLEGLFVSGGDVVLAGTFDRVTLRCCTLDPGSSGATATPATRYATAADGRDLVSCHVRIAGQIRVLEIERCIVGPILAQGTGEVDHVTIADSIVQAIAPDQAIALPAGRVELERCTVLGAAAIHRADVSECILDDIVRVNDVQTGCVRFSAWAAGSALPRRYESVQIVPGAPLFTSRVFGQPGYAQLLEVADAAIVAAATGATITAGAQDGAEMGAFAREKNPIKERSLGIKYEEFMPLGLTPVVVHVT